MSAESILAAARSMLDTPFVHQGRLPGKALDCAGLIITIADNIGVERVDVQAYGRNPFHGLLEATLNDQPSLIRISITDIAAGDILLMRFEKEPQHIAIFAGQTIIHSWSAPGMVVEHRLDDAWRRRIVGAYRFTEAAA